MIDVSLLKVFIDYGGLIGFAVVITAICWFLLRSVVKYNERLCVILDNHLAHISIFEQNLIKQQGEMLENQKIVNVYFERLLERLGNHIEQNRDDFRDLKQNISSKENK